MKTGCFALTAIVAVVYILSSASESPWLYLVVAVVAVSLLLAGLLGFRAKKRADLERHRRTIELLDGLSANFPPASKSSATLRKGEIEIYFLDDVGLLESRSSGSTYSGGNQSLSFRVAKGVSYRVGSSGGSLTRNPEVMQQIDVGNAVFTNQRVIFAGRNTNREWDFSKMLNVDVEPNGTQVFMSVSNRMKTSGLVAVDQNQLAPGLVVAIANDYFEAGEDRARQRCKEIALEIRALVDANSDQSSN